MCTSNYILICPSLLARSHAGKEDEGMASQSKIGEPVAWCGKVIVKNSECL